MEADSGRLGSDRSSATDRVSLRRQNLSIVLSQLHRVGPRSRARLAAETGLNKATVSSLVAELEDRGLVLAGQTERAGAVGRPGQAIELDGRFVVALGAEVNVGYVSVLAQNLRGEVLAEQRQPLDTAHLAVGRVMEELGRLIRGVLQGVGLEGDPVGVCVAVPGLTESADGLLTVAPNLGWHRVSVVDGLREQLGNPSYPVTLDNEANLAAFAENNARAATGIEDLILVTGGAGIGGGIVAGGRLIRGAQGFAGEVGHVRVDPGGRLCGCGRRGCWETVVGLTRLLERAAEPDDPVRDPSLDVERRLAELRRRAQAGDRRTREAFADVGSWIGVGAGTLVNVLNPQLLVLGGYFAFLAEWLREPLIEELERQVFAPATGGCRVEFSTLGFSAAVAGGAQSVLESVFRDPALVPVRHTVVATGRR